MGQRHQLFVIARINGRYRCLAAIHHQWLYGHTALRRCLGTLRIFQDPANRVPIEIELTKASENEEEIWKDTEGRKEPEDEVHFPFVMTCLILGASIGVEDGYYHHVLVEPFNMAYDEGDNNNGITIFDISDPTKVRYCFVDYNGMESNREVQLMSPLSARTYLDAYYKLDESEGAQFLSLVDKFAKCPLIDWQSLEDTWPGEGWEESHDDELQPEDGPGSIQKLHLSEQEVVVSLRVRTLTQLADAVVKCEDIDSDTLSEAEILPDFWSKVKERLYANAGSLKMSNALLDVFAKSLKHERYIDLSPFSLMSITDIREVVSRLSYDASLMELNLSGRLHLSKEEICTVLEKASSSLSKLYIMGDTTISIDDVADLKFNGEVYHHQLLKQPLIERRHYHDRPLPLLGFPAEHPVVHLAWVNISSDFFTIGDSYQDSGLLVWDKLREEYGRGNPWGFTMFDRNPLTCRKYILNDTPMSLVRLILGLNSLVQWASNREMPTSSDLPKLITSCFALGATGSGFPDGVGSLSTELYQEDGDSDVKRGPLPVGGWSILLIHPCADMMPFYSIEEKVIRKIKEIGKEAPFPLERINYALVHRMANDTDEYAVTDVPGFLRGLNHKYAGELSSWWVEQANNKGFLEFYDKPDIQDLLLKVYPPGEDFLHGSEPAVDDSGDAEGEPGEEQA